MKLKIKGHVKIRPYDLNWKLLENEVQETDNIIPTIGLAELAQVLIGLKSIGYSGVGSGTTQPALGDTDLETPIGSRKVITEVSSTGAVCLFSTFYGTTDNNGDWNEFILATESTGANITNHALLSSTFTKDNTKQCYVDYAYTITGA